MGTNIDLDATNPVYNIFSPWYDEIEDSIAGESEIKIKGETYLPMPGGMKFIPNSTNRTNAYNSFKTRASYPELVAPTIRGLCGVIHSSPLEVELPPLLEYIISNATVDGLTLEAAFRRITKNIVSYGRSGVAISIGIDGLPKLAIYKARDIRNWDENRTIVVLDESGSLMQPNLNWIQKEQRLIIEIVDGQATATRYINESGWSQAEDSAIYSSKGGGNIDFLPFVFINTNDLTPNPDEVPLLPLARLAARAYRQDANYQQALTLSSSPTYTIRGMDPDYPNRPAAIGGGVIWYLPDPDQKAEILEYTGTCISDQRQSIQDTLQAAIQAGARLFASSDEQQESGAARKIKYAAQTATLVGIAQTAVAGLEKALKMCAIIAGANQDDVTLNISTNFIDNTIGAQEMTAIIQSVTGGIISEQTGYELFQNGGRANPERDWEDEKKLIDEQVPALGTIGR